MDLKTLDYETVRLEERFSPRVEREDLDLSGQNIRDTRRLTTTSTILRLNLNNNRIATVENLPARLKTLNLAGNSITELKKANLDNLPNLEELNLSRNQIGRIDPDTFEQCKKLRVVDLSHNLLRDNLHSLSTITGLKSLNLSFNLIESLEALKDFFPRLRLLEWFSLAGNPIMKYMSI
eukprot:TRINITY_DN2514_c0_g1_i3.p1 TRINITY_DN2514_c0_g1~~TRINITY_DN2514_c0_g1_i3.p1  ORF type:complete len:179 (-),score=31.72 TRINITY_DN2514_c0_g1_i3:1236-1772(-)